MKSTSQRTLIESKSFPVALVSRASASEKQGGSRPPYWEMVFWWTRKPLASARAVVAASLLPDDIDPKKFVRALSLDKKSPHRNNPVIPSEWSKYFHGKTLLDPFAGFGSIPLEAMRLGLSTTAVELLPTAYTFLGGVLQYPRMYGKEILADVQKWGDWVTGQLKEYSILKKFYDDRTAFHVGTWEVKCPHCTSWTPLIGNFWLARLKNAEGHYRRLAWFDFKKDGVGLSIIITDFAKSIDLRNAIVAKDKVTINGKTFVVPTPNINPRSEQATCLSCGGTIRYLDPVTGKHYLEKKKLSADIAHRLEWYVKLALGKYNRGDSGSARQRLLVKVMVVEDELRFVPCAESDQLTLEIASKEIERLVGERQSDVPVENITPYSVRYLFPILYGVNEWRKLFNSRQLVVFDRLVKLIREASKRVEQEKLAEANLPEEARSYSEAVAVYLGMGLCKYMNYNTLTTWVHASNPWGVDVSPSLATRGIAMQWNWCEVNPFSNRGVSQMLKSPVSWTRALASVVHGLSYLVSALENSNSLSHSNSNPELGRVLLDDATVLSHLDPKDKFDLIVTDPPYYDDVPYTELSDFYYVWLKRCMSDLQDGRLVPRYLDEAFFKKVDGVLVERQTQSEEFAGREVSLNAARFGVETSFEEGVNHFQNLLDASFLSLRSVLQESGVLVTYYAHTDPDAWKALLKSGWQVSGLTVANAFPITTESVQSVVKRGKLSLDTSMVVVWKRESTGSIQASKLYDQMIEASRSRVQSAFDSMIRGRDLFVGSLVAALSEATKYKEIIEMKRLETSELMDKYVLRAALQGLTGAISQKAHVEEGVETNEGMLYLVIKFLYSGSPRKIVTSDDARVFSLGTGIDLSHAVNALKMFRTGTEEEEGEGPSLARRKALVLLEPTAKDRLKMKDLLDYRGVDPENPSIRSSIDALHLLEYYALTYSKEEFLAKVGEVKNQYPSEVEEALSLARVISGSLDNDVERDICNIIAEKTAAVPRTVADYLKG